MKLLSSPCISISFILKIQKKIHFSLWHLIFWVLMIDLDTCIEIFHLI
jgi:hypothetical protein